MADWSCADIVQISTASLDLMWRILQPIKQAQNHKLRVSLNHALEPCILSSLYSLPCSTLSKTPENSRQLEAYLDDWTRHKGVIANAKTIYTRLILHISVLIWKAAAGEELLTGITSLRDRSSTKRISQHDLLHENQRGCPYQR